jgi:hypothetical protein
MQSLPEFLIVIIPRELRFMHDGAPAHFSLVARSYLNRKFPGRWIGKGGQISWPPAHLI